MLRWFELDCKIESTDDRPRGGQYVGTGCPGVRATHLPTQTIAECKLHRSQHKNRVAVMDMLEIALPQPKTEPFIDDK